MTKDLLDVSAGIEAVADGLTALSLLYEDDDGPRASNMMIHNTLYGYSALLRRLLEDLDDIDMQLMEAKKA